MPFRLEVRLTPADVGARVVIRWRRPGGPADGAHQVAGAPQVAGDQVTDVLGILTACDEREFAVRTARGDLVVVPRQRAMAGKLVPAARRAAPGR